MGVSDRRYMSEEDQTFGVGGGRRVSALGLMIIINAGVWIVWQFALHGSEPLREFMAKNFMCSLPEFVANYRYHTLLTHALSHNDLMHLLFNMLALWTFGSEVEHIYGSKNFIFVYLFCGLLGGFAHLLISMGGYPSNMLGASGAVMGLGVIAAIYNPNRPIHLYGIIKLTLKWLVVGYIVLDVLGMLQASGSRIAHAAHLGGALGGLLYWKLDLRLFASRGRKNSGAFQRIRGWFNRPKLKTVRKASEREYADSEPEVGATASRRVSPMHMNASNARPVSRVPSVDAETAQRVDALLAKISRNGMNSLTDEERSFLKASSEKYKKR